MSLPLLKENSRCVVVEAVHALRRYFPEITAAWRARMFEEFQFDGRVMATLERLNLGTGLNLCCQGDFHLFTENLRYYGTRLAKLQVETSAVSRSLELYQLFCEPYVAKVFGTRRSEVVAALEMFSSSVFVSSSQAYFESQKNASMALLSILDAELSAPDVSALLKRVLEITAANFGAQFGVILLREPESELLRVKASVGFNKELDDDFGLHPGEGFSGKVALNGEPDCIPDVSTYQGDLNTVLLHNAKSLWAVPLKKNADEIIGIMVIGFAKPYQWLPTEKDLLRSIADRSALAIDRAQMTEALREREFRIAQLSGHLLRVQEEERKRISRELHDETGQGLMVIRLYLGMLESSLHTRTTHHKLEETLSVVDRTIEGLRRMIGKLSPLVLQELGLVAAIQKEAKDLSKNTGVKTGVEISDEVGRMAPDTETAIYRVVQEALHNVAKHAQAKNVTIHMIREDGQVRLLVEDDGIGFLQRNVYRGRSFGLAGMRERVATLGGTVRVRSSKGRGTRIEVTMPDSVPAMPAAAETPYQSRALAMAGISAAS